MSTLSMTPGDSAASTVGPSASVVGKQNSGLMSIVRDTILTGVMLNAMEGKGQPVMRPGDSMMQALGGGAEVYSKNPNSNLTKAVTGIVLLGIVGKLLDANTAPPPTQEQMRAEYAAKEDQRIAGIMKEDAQKKEALAEDERRKAFFANKPG
ncbi:MAG: hypothetical protein JNM12_10595 [Alphaproteobacteria bacterium]|nr:hypothetical protein [Alphaproteobacteria bacterium]